MSRAKPEGRARKVRSGVYEYRGFTISAIGALRGAWVWEHGETERSKRAAMLAIDAWHEAHPAKSGHVTKRPNHRTKTGQLRKRT